MSKKIAVLITDDFEDSEFTSPAEAFKLAGHHVVTIEKQAGKTVKGKQGEAEVAIDKAIDSRARHLRAPCGSVKARVSAMANGTGFQKRTRSFAGSCQTVESARILTFPNTKVSRSCPQ